MAFKRGSTLPDTVVFNTVPCAHEGCNVPALCRVWTPTGWANLCVPHYAEEPVHKRPMKSNPVCNEIREAYQRKVSAPMEEREAA